MAVVLTLRQYVALHLGETVRVLQQDASIPYDGKEGRPDAVGAHIMVALAGLLGASAVEDDLSQFARNYVGMDASRRIIPIAINYHLERTGLSDKISSPGRGTALAVNETRQHYDRVRALQELDKLLAEQMAADLAVFVNDTGTIREPGRNRGAAITSDGIEPLTQDPRRTYPSIGPSRPVVGLAFGGTEWVEV